MTLEQLLEHALNCSGTLPVMVPLPDGEFIEATGYEVQELELAEGGSIFAFLLLSEEPEPRRVRVNLPDDAPIHTWFGLSYAQYLSIPRSALQTMPSEWQERFTQCLEELDESIDWRPAEGRYWVQLKNDKGQFIHDPLQDYQKGRRRLPLRGE